MQHLSDSILISPADDPEVVSTRGPLDWVSLFELHGKKANVYGRALLDLVASWITTALRLGILCDPGLATVVRVCFKTTDCEVFGLRNRLNGKK